MSYSKATLEQSRLLNSKEEYNKVLELLTAEIEGEKIEGIIPEKIIEFKSDLYAEKAEAFHGLRQMQSCKKVIVKALSLNPENELAKYYKGYLLFHFKKYKKAIKFYKQAIKKKPGFVRYYNGLGAIYKHLKDYDIAEATYQKASFFNKDYCYSYNALGDIYRDRGKKETNEKTKSRLLTQSEKYYKDAISKKNDFSFPHNGLGDIYALQGQYESAIENYEKAIELDKFKSFIDPYYNLAQTYYNYKDYPSSLKIYESYLQLKDKLYEESSSHNFKRSTFNPTINDYYYSRAKARVEKLKIIVSNDEFRKVHESVIQIKAILLFEDDCITHYTSLSASKSLILNKSPFRLSEGVFLNDTSEGRELFNYLGFPNHNEQPTNTVTKSFARRPFIGSFVPEAKHNDLTLWRMYGKENKEEGKGCALTLKRKELLTNLVDKVVAQNENVVYLKTEEDFKFYRVAYKKQEKDLFIIPGKPEKEQDLFNLMIELKTTLNSFKSNNDKSSISAEILELLSEIAYLFKTADYEYEHEIRLVLNGSGIKKNLLVNGEVLRVYIELDTINPLIKEITLGPKVEKSDEWAAAFYYSLDKESRYPYILISHLPFK